MYACVRTFAQNYSNFLDEAYNHTAEYIFQYNSLAYSIRRPGVCMMNVNELRGKILRKYFALSKVFAYVLLLFFTYYQNTKVRYKIDKQPDPNSLGTIYICNTHTNETNFYKLSIMHLFALHSCTMMPNLK